MSEDDDGLGPGSRVGPYVLKRLLGRGGMAAVYEAEDTGLDRVVALKLMSGAYSQDPDFKKRLQREARIAGRLHEPHVVPIHEAGEADGRLFVDMRLIEGTDLATVLKQSGSLAPTRAVAIVRQVASALDAAHRAGVIHRDVKPANILLTEDDFACLVDFGIANAVTEEKLTQFGDVLGTWSYMAPERFSGDTDKVTHRVDVYALACVLYELLTGTPPYRGDHTALMGAHLSASVPKPSFQRPWIPQELDEVIARGMAKNPWERYPSAMELARAAHNAVTTPLARPGSTVPVRPPTPPDHLIAAGPTHVQAPQFAATSAAPAPQPPSGPPRWPPPTPQAVPTPPAPERPVWRRPRVVIPAVVAITVLIAGGIVVAVKVAHPHNNNPSTAAAPPTTAPANAGPFTGTYTADLAAETNLDGKTFDGAAPAAAETWGIRSVCPSTGCVATASRRSGQTAHVSTLVFDDVGGRWLAVGVGVGAGTCRNVPSERWDVITLQPRPDGTFSGEYSTVTSIGCESKRAVTFTRSGDVDVNSLPDPATQPPRVVSPAEALHGRYHNTITYSNGGKLETDFAVRTDCLRTGDRCMSYFHNPDNIAPLVFGSGTWIWNSEKDDKCPAGDPEKITQTAQFALPAPPQDPITLLTAHGHHEQTGSCATSLEMEMKFVRTGD